MLDNRSVETLEGMDLLDGLNESPETGSGVMGLTYIADKVDYGHESGMDKENVDEIDDEEEEDEEELKEEEEVLKSSENTNYYRTIKSIPILTQEEERRLANQLKSGSRQEQLHAREQLITHNLRYVMKIAMQKYTHNPACGLSFDDLYQEGCLGLMRSLVDYDPDKARLTTYATNWISQKIDRAIADKANIIRKPVHAKVDIVSLNRARVRLESENKAVTTDALMEETGLSYEKVMLLLSSMDPLSLDREVQRDGSSDDCSTLGELIADEAAKDPENEAINGDMVRTINQVMEQSLTPKEREIISLRFGLNGQRQLTLEEIGKLYGVTRERVRQIEARALNRLRNPKYKRKLQGYI